MKAQAVVELFGFGARGGKTCVAKSAPSTFAPVTSTSLSVAPVKQASVKTSVAHVGIADLGSSENASPALLSLEVGGSRVILRDVPVHGGCVLKDRGG